VPSEPQPLIPLSGERGLASYDADRLAALVLAAWDAFLEVAQDVDLDAPSRCPGWSARALLAHLASWPDHPLVDGAWQEARTGLTLDADTATTDQEGRNDRVVRAYGDAAREDLLEALRRGRDEAAALLGDEEARSFAAAATPTMLGPLPLFGFVAALPYELAVHALDLVPCGAPPAPPRPLLQAAVASLVDVTGALAARSGVTATFAAITPEGTWAAGAGSGDWTTVDLGAHRVGWPAIAGPATTILDVSAGRAAAPPLLLTRELRLQRVAGLLELAPVLENVPGLPGGPALRTTARYLGGVGRLVRRLPGMR
jgi:uncharacterized protein (TIGR03083 family)